MLMFGSSTLAGLAVVMNGLTVGVMGLSLQKEKL